MKRLEAFRRDQSRAFKFGRETGGILGRDTYISGGFLELLQLLHDSAVVVHCNFACVLSTSTLQLIISCCLALMICCSHALMRAGYQALALTG